MSRTTQSPGGELSVTSCISYIAWRPGTVISLTLSSARMMGAVMSTLWNERLTGQPGTDTEL